jgi:cyclophilin family peptidyl-prolyl cis-trans isomerase
MVKTMSLDALVVLGCRVDARGKPLPAAQRRIERALQAYQESGEPPLILSGGKRWHGRSEAQVFADELARLGVPRERLLCEELSLSTRGNARHSCALARARGFVRLGIVSCEWHLGRARNDFRRYGFDVEVFAAKAPPHVSEARRWTERAQALWDSALIRLEQLGVLLFVLLASVVACQRSEPPGAGSKSASVVAQGPPLAARLRALREAELARRANAIPQESLTSPISEVRIAAMRALSRSADAGSAEALLSGLADESPRVLEFAAFGLSRAGAGRVPAASRACALRAATLVAREPSPAELDAMMSALAGALGRLANDEAERTLRSWLSFDAPIAGAAALALGELAARRGRLEDETLVLLLDAAERKPAPIEGALYAFSRISVSDAALAQRVLEVATRALAPGSIQASDALRTLERAGAVEPLARGLDDEKLRAELGAELVRALSRLGDGGKAALNKHLQSAANETNDFARLLESADFPRWLALLEASGGEAEKSRSALLRLAQLEIPRVPWKARRALLLRCGAARILAGKAWDSAELSSCDPSGDDRIEQLAVLAVLDRDKLVGARGKRYRELTNSSDAVVRQAALRLLGTHPEVERPSELLTRALADEAPGCVAAAAEVLAQQPERGLRGGGAPGAELSEALVRAYRSYANGENPAVLSALIDASASLQILSLKADLERSCNLGSATLREHAERALMTLDKTQQRCPPPSASIHPPAELDHLRTKPFRVLFDTDLGELTLELDPTDAPVAVTRIADLVKAGFFDGIEIHRFVPGFVLQFGDRDGDGYGGARRPLLRSELAPRRFRPRAIGLAESGPDTGSSQIFVTLGRFPHLDGNATYLGEAGPGWERLVLYDRIVKARLSE